MWGGVGGWIFMHFELDVFLKLLITELLFAILLVKLLHSREEEGGGGGKD